MTTLLFFSIVITTLLVAYLLLRFSGREIAPARRRGSKHKSKSVFLFESLGISHARHAAMRNALYIFEKEAMRSGPYRDDSELFRLIDKDLRLNINEAFVLGFIMGYDRHAEQIMSGQPAGGLITTFTPGPSYNILLVLILALGSLLGSCTNADEKTAPNVAVSRFGITAVYLEPDAQFSIMADSTVILERNGILQRLKAERVESEGNTFRAFYEGKNCIEIDGFTGRTKLYKAPEYSIASLQPTIFKYRPYGSLSK